MKSSFKKIVIILVLMVVVCAISLSIMKLNRNNDSNADATNTTEPQVELSIVAPSGAPALSLAGVINDPTLLLNYEIVDGADVLSAEFTSAEKDLIIAPVNLGNKLISNGANYKMIGVVTWGNLYIAGNEAFGEKLLHLVRVQYQKKSLTMYLAKKKILKLSILHLYRKLLQC